MLEAASVHGQVGVYGGARGDAGHQGRGLQKRGGVYPHSFGDDAFQAGGHGYESCCRLSFCEVRVDVV